MSLLFLSHASADHAFAAAICHALEEQGHACWIAPRDVRPGFGWDDEVQAGLEAATGLVLVLSAKAADSDTVHKEVARAVARELTVLPARIDDVEATGGLALQLGTTQRLEAVDHTPEDLGQRIAAWAAEHVPRSPASSDTRPLLSRALLGLSSTSVVFERRALLKEAESHLPRPIVLHGLPGFGKTVALRRLAERIARPHELVFAITFTGPAAVQPAFALEGLARSAGLPGREHDSGDPLPWLGRILQALAGRPAIVLLDRVDDAPRVIRAALVNGLASCSGLRLLATARQLGPELAALDPVRVPPLTRTEATSFVATHTHQWRLGKASRELLLRLSEPLWSHPASLSILLAGARDLPANLILAGLEDLPGLEVSQRVIQRVVEALPPPTLRMLALAELLQGAPPDQLLGLDGMPTAGELMTELRRLLAAGLLLRRGDSYDVSAIVSSALERVDPSLGSVATGELTDAVLQLPADEAADRAELIGGLTARLQGLAEWASVTRLAQDALLEALNDRGSWKQYALLLHGGIRAAEEEGDLERRLSLGLRLCRKLMQIGQRDEARTQLAQVEALAPATPNEPLQAELSSHRAILRDRRTEGALAVRELTESRVLRTALGDRTGAAVCSKLLGHVHLQEGELEQAEVEYRRALEEDTLPARSRAEAELGVATCEHRTGRLDEAQAKLDTLLEQAATGKMAASEPRIRYTLAMILEDRGDRVGAREQLSRAIALAEQTEPRLAAVMRMMQGRLEQEGEE